MWTNRIVRRSPWVPWAASIVQKFGLRFYSVPPIFQNCALQLQAAASWGLSYELTFKTFSCNVCIFCILGDVGQTVDWHWTKFGLGCPESFDFPIQSEKWLWICFHYSYIRFPPPPLPSGGRRTIAAWFDDARAACPARWTLAPNAFRDRGKVEWNNGRLSQSAWGWGPGPCPSLPPSAPPGVAEDCGNNKTLNWVVSTFLIERRRWIWIKTHSFPLNIRRHTTAHHVLLLKGFTVSLPA